ncbi:hypothetical protein LBWT_X1240 (plasmid) [Leptolyngbya boryana IAM M-101]|nr:hypothetical protein LBWT_X1240 [Leptolyngbya boryana IAM M-101]BAS66400.1 hypothetical protein LBDG_X1240 [Leptolyngbya boryana dg5]
MNSSGLLLVSSSFRVALCANQRAKPLAIQLKTTPQEISQ